MGVLYAQNTKDVVGSFGMDSILMTAGSTLNLL